MAVERVEDLDVDRRAFQASMEIPTQSREGSKVERHALTDQIRRASRAAGATLSEAWRKRRCPTHFVGKLPDVDAEANEPRTGLRSARSWDSL
ncbi:MAG: four helix bundle protein [Salinibacter sp.]|uniref:four helix bundle protein n=1 Tax=Salinibacter sp. TaxID=2065818 RepID=UPI0035D469A2